MTKLLVVLVVVAVALWALLSRNRRPVRPGEAEARPRAQDAAKAPASPASAQDMVRCAHCGLHLPAADAVQAGGRPYCGAEHAAAGPGGP